MCNKSVKVYEFVIYVQLQCLQCSGCSLSHFLSVVQTSTHFHSQGDASLRRYSMIIDIVIFLKTEVGIFISISAYNIKVQLKITNKKRLETKCSHTVTLWHGIIFICICRATTVGYPIIRYRLFQKHLNNNNNN